ncbi:MAG: endonuclease [Eubacterium sp.]|jgi:hypothetical protein|nr:endonuclease [Eubacterium sp.]
MAQKFSKWFYISKAWLECRAAYIKSVFGLCEICGKPGYIVHHKNKLTPQNINDPSVTLNWSNLEYVCLDCHNKDKFGEHTGKKKRYIFDGEGNVLPPSRKTGGTFGDRVEEVKKTLQ